MKTIQISVPFSFQNAGTIARKELRSYFNSIIAYVVMIVFYALMAWFYAGNIFLNNTATLRDMFEYAGIIFLFIVPAMTMRLLSEEKKSGTRSCSENFSVPGCSSASRSFRRSYII
jgi:small neutral amino acid transporter SnatA (MarC family)